MRPINLRDDEVRGFRDGTRRMLVRPVKFERLRELDGVGYCGSQWLLEDDGRWALYLEAWPKLGRWGRASTPTMCPFGSPGEQLCAVTLKSIKDCEGTYAAGDDGLIYRVDGEAPRPIKGTPTGRGYLCVTLSIRGKRRTAHVHVLVCSAFYGERPGEGIQVRHINGDRVDNRPENLDWGTPEQKRADRRALKRGYGEEHWNAKLNEGMVREIRESSESQRSLARRFGVSQSAIAAAHRRRSWNPPSASPPNFPRWASRLTLTTKSVRVVRVQEISEEDAASMLESHVDDGVTYYGPFDNGHASAECELRRQWTQHHGKSYPWDSNPWAWLGEMEGERA